MAFIPLKEFLSIWHFKLIGLIGPRAVSERVNEKIKGVKSYDNFIEQPFYVCASITTCMLMKPGI